jgi:hypothetical protein
MDLRNMYSELYGSSSKSCPVAGFGISGFEFQGLLPER